MKYVYPAVFTPSEDGYDVYFPDLFGCRTCAANLAEAIEMAEDAAATWLWANEQDKTPIPLASKSVDCILPQFVTHIKADTDAHRRRLDARAVKKTLTLPAWLNYEAEAAHINFSGVLQDALKQRLGI
jgi:predicted RNase H-like HicB family nuclease